MYNLFLDDIRTPESTYTYMIKKIGKPALAYLNVEWTIVRNYLDFISEIEQKGLPELISFDHDLADEHYDPSMYLGDYPTEFLEKTGFECAKWLVEYCLDNDLDTPPFLVHSMNPVGSERISGLLNNYSNFYNH